MTESHFSRRQFLLSSIVSCAGTAMWLELPSAWAKKPAAVSGPHAVASQEWPPAIVPDHMGVDRGYCCFTDEFGRLAIVDLRRPGDAKHPPHVVAELNGLGKKVIDFKVVPGRGYGVVLKGTEGNEQLTLVCINLQTITDPSVIGQAPLDKFNDVSCLTANNNLVCVAGTSFSGENLLAIYQVQPRGRTAEPSLAATWTAKNPIVDMDLQDRNLAILESSQLDYLGLVTPSVPDEKGTVNLDGDFKAMARFRDAVLVAGTAGGDKDNSSASGDSVAKCISLEPTPKVVSKLALDPITNVLDACSLKDRFMVLGDGATERYIASLPFDKLHQLSRKQVVALPKDKGNNAFGQHASVLMSGKSAYIASGWAGVQVMAQAGESWTPTYTYTIPRLPASGIATWGDKVVISGSDLKLYDISQPQRLELLTTASLPSTVRSIVGAGSYVVCLSKDQMTLRKMDNLATPVATIGTVGQQVCYDKVDQRAYVLHDQTKTTSVTKFKMYSNDIVSEKSFDVPGSFVRGSASGGSLALCGLNDVTLFGLAEKAEAIGTRHFENLAIRDIALLDQLIAASAVDQKSKGFLLLLSKDQKDLRVLGSLDLPHDAIALAAAKNKVVVIGQTPDGKALATIVDISNTAVPKIVSNISAIEAASAIAIKDQYAIIAGRGIEIISLS